MPFDYENARRDIADSGADPDYLDTLNPEKRDAYLRKLGMRPETYGGGSKDPYYKKKQSSQNNNDDGCFLTSACVTAKGLPDDCEELQTLRQYRDHYLRNTPDGDKEIEEYYRLAPEIVKAVNARPNADTIWERIYRELVLVCSDLIHTGKNEEAFILYKSYALALKQKYCGFDY